MGLGNPGERFAQSRHNIGFRCVDLLAQRHQVQVAERRRHVLLGQGAVIGQRVVLAKPRTYMNASGTAVRYLRDRFRTGASRLLVVVDDMDLPLGTLRLRSRGSSGGQQGLESIIAELGSQAFPRLRIGVGRPQHTRGAIEHVLGRFSAQERPLAEEAVARAADAVEVLLSEGIDEAMNRFN